MTRSEDRGFLVEGGGGKFCSCEVGLSLQRLGRGGGSPCGWSGRRERQRAGDEVSKTPGNQAVEGLRGRCQEFGFYPKHNDSSWVDLKPVRALIWFLY